MVGMVGVLAASAIATPTAAADPRRTAPTRSPAPTTHDRARPHSCRVPACSEARPAKGHDDDQPFKPFNPKIHLGKFAVASMEGLWLRHGPKVHDQPVMVSPIVVGDAIVMALGGKF